MPSKPLCLVSYTGVCPLQGVEDSVDRFSPFFRVEPYAHFPTPYPWNSVLLQNMQLWCDAASSLPVHPHELPDVVI